MVASQPSVRRFILAGGLGIAVIAADARPFARGSAEYSQSAPGSFTLLG